MNLDFLKGNPALNDISPEKLQFLMDFASNNADKIGRASCRERV